jgi:N-methylhydantoinase A
VTDAHLILGRIDPARPISSPEGFLLAIEPAREVVEQQIAIPLGLSIEEAAEAIVRVVNNRMAGAIRRVSVDRGRDPRDFVLFAFGGAGALHVCDLLYELGGHRAMIPPFPGVTSAWGCAVADLRYDFVTMVNRYTEELDLEEVRRTFTGHVEEGRKMLEKMAHKLERVVILAEADMSYERQTHLIRVPLDLRRLSRERIGRVFRKVYLERYGGRQRAFDGLESLLDRIPIRLIALRTAVIGVRPRMMTSFKPPRVSLGEAHVGQHSVYLGGRFCDCPVYERTMLPLGTRLSGPAILRQDDTTIWIVPGAEAQTDERGNLLLEVNAR